MSSCCSHFECEANQQFNQKKVEQELKRYRAKGPGPTTRLLVDGISQSGALAGTVLDVGSGFGGLTLALLERGASSAVAVDASAAYVGAARDEAHRQGRSVEGRAHAAQHRLDRARIQCRGGPAAQVDTVDPPAGMGRARLGDLALQR